MGLFSIFQRKSAGMAKTPPVDTSPDAVQEARTRARRRLIGAAVLVVIGVIGFPLLFETQPRPIPVDIPIEIPRKEGAPPLVMPAKPAAKPVAAAPAASATSQIVTETVADAGRELPAPATKPASAATKPASAAAPKPAVVAAAKPASTAAPSSAAESRRAKALLDGDAPDKDTAKDGRFVVQVGAFADAAAARDTRQKVEKLGLKTYTQVAETASGSRIRVRVGPFASRDEAERAQAKIRAAGASAVVLTL